MNDNSLFLAIRYLPTHESKLSLCSHNEKIMIDLTLLPLNSVLGVGWFVHCAALGTIGVMAPPLSIEFE